MKEIHKKLLAIQQRLKAPKENYNEFNNFNYRSAEDILEAVKPLLAEQELTLVLSDEMVNLGDRYYIKATATISDGEEEISSTAWAREDPSRAGMSESQVTGCSSSYSRKYALAGLFCIGSEKDPDAFDNRATKGANGAGGTSPHPQPKNVSTGTGSGKNEEILKRFCGEKKFESGIDMEELKKFYRFYEKKMSTWKGEFRAQDMWVRWMETARQPQNEGMTEEF